MADAYQCSLGLRPPICFCNGAFLLPWASLWHLHSPLQVLSTRPAFSSLEGGLFVAGLIHVSGSVPRLFHHPRIGSHQHGRCRLQAEIKLVPSGTTTMPILTLAQQTGVFGKADLDLLSRVYSQAALFSSDEEERANCARATIALFRSGVTDEATLVRMVMDRGWVEGLLERVQKTANPTPQSAASEDITRRLQQRSLGLQLSDPI